MQQLPKDTDLDTNSSSPKNKSKKNQKYKLNRSVLNVIRTTQRNNINLKHIADNKANILLGVNALMITFLIPIIIANQKVIVSTGYIIPIGILSITCLITVILSAGVLRPFSARGKIMGRMTKSIEKSPFFFETYDSMEMEEYYEYFCQISQDEEVFFKYVVEDLQYFGKILSLKYDQIKHAFTGFIIGVSLSTLALIIISLLNLF